MARQAGQATLSDVARAAGVSLATASRVLNGARGRTVRPELAAQVHEAAETLGYSVNAHAQAMARGHTTTVGLIVHDIADPYAAGIAAGVITAASARGLLVTIASTRFDPELELRHVQALVQQRARAVILAGSRFTDDADATTLRPALDAVIAAGGNTAVIGHGGRGVATVEVPNREGAANLAHTLHGIGYRRFAILAGPEALVTSEERLTGFRDGLAECDVAVAPENIIGAQFTRDGGYVAMRELLDRGLAAECVFAANDVMAVGAMAALREQGHRVGIDIALAGFDDIPMLRDIEPSLTTVRLPLADMGRAAVELALDAPAETADDNDAGQPVDRPVGAEVVVRASTPGLPR